MRYLILAAVLIGIFALFTPYTTACTCVPSDISQAFDKAPAVFVGEVAEIVKPRTENLKAPLADRLYTVKFKVEKSWKGAGFREIAIPEITVLSDQGRVGCFSWGPFLEGRKYLVYAEETEEKDLAVLFSCNRTASLANASEDIKELEKMWKPSFKYRLRRPSGWKISPLGAHNNSFNRTRWKASFDDL